MQSRERDSRVLTSAAPDNHDVARASPDKVWSGLTDGMIYASTRGNPGEGTTMNLLPHRLNLSWAACPFVALVVLALAWVLPAGSRNPLVETAVWASLCVVSFVGWGSLVRFGVARQERVDLGLRVVWGLALVCFLGGSLMVPALMTRTMAIVLVEAGLVMACSALILERHAVGAVLRTRARLLRVRPAFAFASIAVLFIIAIPCLGGIADWHTNPYDDDIAYLAFMKKLADTGTVLEPFSFRRLSAYGGQTLFLELTSVRASASQAHTFDRCICFVIVVLLMLGHRPRGRRPSWLVVMTSLSMLATLPIIAINTASYWSGVAVFLGLYRTLVWADEHERLPTRSAVPLALVAAVGCTLRQNYLAIPALVLGASYLFRFFKLREPFVRRLIEPAIFAALSVLFLAPWMIVSWQSSRTILFPIIPGTFNVNLALNATGWNIIRELGLQFDVAVEALPLRTLPIFMLAVLFTPDRATKRAPLAALTLGALGGLWILVHSLTQADAQTIGRYAFGFMIPVALSVALSAGRARMGSRKDPRLVGAGLVLFATLAQLITSREELVRDASLKFRNIEHLYYGASRVTETEVPEGGVYARLQNAVPPGERIAVLVDEPYYLDFARNPIWNLDMPGYASLAPGMPFFAGSQAVEDYFRGLGVRWLMFVIPDASRYQYRREYLLELFINEQEVWRTYGPYLVNYLDSEIEIGSRHRKVASERGMVVIDLSAPSMGGALDQGVPTFANDPVVVRSADAGAPPAGKDGGPDSDVVDLRREDAGAPTPQSEPQTDNQQKRNRP